MPRTLGPGGCGARIMCFNRLVTTTGNRRGPAQFRHSESAFHILAPGADASARDAGRSTSGRSWSIQSVWSG